MTLPSGLVTTDEVIKLTEDYGTNVELVRSNHRSLAPPLSETPDSKSVEFHREAGLYFYIDYITMPAGKK